ncbi:MAG: hypothetical protein AB1792_06405 [Candidatus Zixiibacteriota bacterium]
MHRAILPPMDTATPTASRTTVGLYAALVVAYVGIAILFTWPLILHFTTHTPEADASGDQFQTIWFFWWMKKALFALHQNPYWTTDIYFPYGTGLAYHLCPLTNLVALAVSTITGAAINSTSVFNALIVLSFVLTGLAAFTLIRQFSGSTLAAFWGSIFIVGAPYRIWHLNHLNLLSFGWGILAVHFALRLLRQPGIRPAIGAAVCLTAMFHTCLTGTAFTVLLLIGCVLVDWGAFREAANRRRILMMAALSAAIVAVLVVPGLIALRHVDSPWNLRWEDTVQFSAAISDLFVPTTQTSLVAQWLHLEGGFAPGLSSEIFLGWILLAATVAVIVLLRRHAPWRWLVLAAVFLILSLGPTLKISGRYLFDGIMPYRWLFDTVPYLGLSRTPGRLAMLGHLCLVVFCACGFAIWRAQHPGLDRALRRVPVAIIATLVLIVGLFLEYTRTSIRLWEMTVPPIYQQVASDPSIRAIYDGPIAASSQICNRYMYWQTFHGKKSANGYITHRSRKAWTLFDRMSQWRQFGDAERAELRTAGIDAMVWHEESGETRLIRLP